MSCHFIGYSEKSKGYKFYCPNTTTRILETNKAKFIEDYETMHREENFAFENVPEENESSSAIILPVLPINDISDQQNEVEVNHG